MRGRVIGYDEARGLGTIDAEGVDYPFHCTQIVDGSRTIEVGTQVAFELRAGHLGRYEAVSVTKLA